MTYLVFDKGKASMLEFDRENATILLKLMGRTKGVIPLLEVLRYPSLRWITKRAFE